jgi:glutaminyl-peptide cyclotransferase
MIRRFSSYIFAVAIILPGTLIFSCSGKSGSPAGSTPVVQATAPAPEVEANLIRIVSPAENTGFKLHDAVKVVIAPDKKNVLPDSVVIYFDGKRIASLKGEPWEYSISPSFTVTTGRKSLKVAAFSEGRARNTVTRIAIVYSDIAPAMYGYKVVNVYPHDPEAFIQGLFYDHGLFYEGTGETGSSSLREVEPKTGKVIRQHNLSADLFGEGITLSGDRVYQVTWQNKVGFVYEKSTFKVLNKVYYQTEGWGLATVGDRIVMSDGSNILYFFEPETFTVVSQLEVYDNKKKVDQLNELEYIDGEIWANIWTTDQIARIDPSSGKLLGYVDLKGILPDSERSATTDVLNGIAYDATTGRIFVTGKRWPRLYEIKVTK